MPLFKKSPILTILNWLKAMEVLDAPVVRKCRWLAELRNEIVHSIKHFDFNLQKFLEEPTPSDLNHKQRWIDPIGYAPSRDHIEDPEWKKVFQIIPSSHARSIVVMHLCHLAMLCQFPASFFRSVTEIISAYPDMEPEAVIQMVLTNYTPSGGSEAS
jgi:hypothetical protein